LKEIVITTEDHRMRAAVLEEGRLAEVLDDSGRESRLAGNIYKGKVSNIVTGIQAAFIDIGLEKNAFLYAGDIVNPEYVQVQNVPGSPVPPIESLLKEGQEVIVQVTREAVGNKGARVTTNLSLPGRFVVLLPGNRGYLGISRKITDETERERLNQLAQNLSIENAGLIVRTMAEGVAEKELADDIEKILEINQTLTERIKSKSGKGLIYSSSDPLSRLLRETIDEEVTRIITDDGEMAELLRTKLREVRCSVSGKIWTDFKGNLFERYHIGDEILKALKPKVPLESGGYLVIEQTEALTAIDVNSGKYTGESSLQHTLQSLNMEAATEISRQIRLRNLSGIIIVDFIDMEQNEDWNQLLEMLEKSFKQDKVKCKVVGRTRLGLVEVTRKKEGQTLAARNTEKCRECGGKGWHERRETRDEGFFHLVSGQSKCNL